MLRQGYFGVPVPNLGSYHEVDERRRPRGAPSRPGIRGPESVNSGPSWLASRESWIWISPNIIGKSCLGTTARTLPGVVAVAGTPEEAGRAADTLGGTVAVKAQVLTGGRGKAGGIKVVSSPREAEEAAGEILGMDIRGHTVRRVYVEGGAEIDREFYLSITVDRTAKRPLILSPARLAWRSKRSQSDPRPSSAARRPLVASCPTRCERSHSPPSSKGDAARAW